jgi:hypothetical protein
LGAERNWAQCNPCSNYVQYNEKHRKNPQRWRPQMSTPRQESPTPPQQAKTENKSPGVHQRGLSLVVAILFPVVPIRPVVAILPVVSIPPVVAILPLVFCLICVD